MPSTTPDSVKADAAPIAFVLDDQTTKSSPLVLTLYIRPEEMTRSYPSRMATHHTFGGAFADSFGAGVETVNISGTSGWRRVAGSGINNASADGFERFVELYSLVFSGWHTKRAAAVDAGKDPAGVKLIMADSLNNVANVVAPQNFTLRRSKSRPLLAQYAIQLVVVERNVEQTYVAPASRTSTLAAGIDSLRGSIGQLGTLQGQLQSFVPSTLYGTLQQFVGQASALYGKVADAVATVGGATSALLKQARDLASAGVNVFRSLAAIASIPTLVRGQLMRVGAEFSNIVCLLSNSLRAALTFTDYSALYGASNCSSTNGGRGASPLAGVNPFYAVVPAASSSGALGITLDAQAALRSLAHADVVASPIPTLAIGSLARSVNDGISP